VVVWILVGLVTLMRCLAVFRVPMTGDEAYYWEWSRHLAFGYVDHPPMVAWTVALFAPFGTDPGVTRLGFVLCGLIATLAGAACATRLANGDRRAGAVTALAITLTPLLWLAFGSVQPDGPYLASWTVSLWLAVRAFQTKRRLDYALLGVAMGACVLSRMFGFALVAGIALYALVPSRRYLWREGLGMSFGILAVCFAPFVWWNATHNWVTFAFTFIGRHTLEAASADNPLKRFLGLYAVEAAAYSPGFFAAALYCAFRPRRPLLAYTAIPLLVLMSVLVWFEKVEIHWIFGAYASLCIAIGVEYTNLSHRKRIVWASASLVPAFFLLPLIFVAAVAPGEAYQAFRNSGSTLRNTGPFEIFTVWPLAQEVRRLADEHKALVMTDGYGLSSMLDYDAGVKPVVIGYNWQGRESRRWYPSTRALTNPTLFVDKESLFKRPGHPLDAGRADFARQLERACGRVEVDPKPLAYSVMGVPPREYFLTWCVDPKPDALAILRWQREPSSVNERPWERVAFRSAKTARP
jgi:4-amino-4-deoxy-L-arabinose transferase-like glycosyltransferase